jgi:uncharacterized protein DUF4145
MPGPRYNVAWPSVQGIAPSDFTCGYCGREVSAIQGIAGHGRFLDAASGQPTSNDGATSHVIAICPRCGGPTYLRDDVQTPPVTFGEPVQHIPSDIDALYQEARRSIGAGNHNAAVMIARKLLMNIAVTKGAPENGSFKSYVDHLANEGIVTADMKQWVDEIRELGNDANHELPDVTKDEAEAILTFVTMLLKLVYEYPELGRRSVAARAAKAQQPTTP